MGNSYTQIHYNEELRPRTKFPRCLCQYLADTYFKARSGKILDVCCGRGEFLEIFNDLGFEAYGVDNDPVTGKEKLKVKIANVDLEKLPYQDNFFDFIMIKSAIEHVGNVSHLMDNLYRVLKPGGKIIILTPDWKVVYKIFYDDFDHKSPFTKFSLHDLLLRYNFKSIMVEDIYYLPFSWRNRFYKLIPRLIAFLIPINFSPTVKFTPLIKLIKFSREKQLLACGEK